jgi:putative tricarboxylic transport membrane protein
MAPPGISPQQKAALTELIDKLVKSPAWAEVLKQKGWDNAYLSGDAFAAFLKQENARVTGVLKSIGLVKS